MTYKSVWPIRLIPPQHWPTSITVLPHLHQNISHHVNIIKVKAESELICEEYIRPILLSTIQVFGCIWNSEWNVNSRSSGSHFSSTLTVGVEIVTPEPFCSVHWRLVAAFDVWFLVPKVIRYLSCWWDVILCRPPLCCLFIFLFAWNSSMTWIQHFGRPPKHQLLFFGTELLEASLLLYLAHPHLNEIRGEYSLLDG